MDKNNLFPENNQDIHKKLWQWSIFAAVMLMIWWQVATFFLNSFLFILMPVEIMFFMGAIVEFLFLFVFAVNITLKCGGSLKSIGLGKGISTTVVGRGLRYGLLIYFISMAASWLVGLFFPGEREVQEIISVIAANQDKVVFIGFLIITVVLAPLSEEVFFRGIFYTALRTKLKKWVAAVICSVIFAALHGNIWVMISIFVCSLFLCHLYEKYRNIWINVLAHAVWNAITIIILVVSTGLFVS
ncbi:MAG: CPBP family intramembrane glutamic endopeptidase [Bacillota bacterium]|jgi:membrane protease YdiL (CAAX protease family)